MFKFRGMYQDARQRFPHLYDYRYTDGEVRTLLFHRTADPRVTRAGRLLRKTSIDELPNLINVLRGDMSLVGPRPDIPEMIPYYGSDLPLLLSVQPGVTSLAKCSGRDELSFAQTVEYEMAYVRDQSLALDLRILVRTLLVVVQGDAAS